MLSGKVTLSLDHSFNFSFIRFTFLCQCTWLEFCYHKRIPPFTLPSLFYVPLANILKKGHLYSLPSLFPIDSFAIKLSFSHSCFLQGHQWPASCQIWWLLLGSYLVGLSDFKHHLVKKNYYEEFPTCTNVERINDVEARKRWCAIHLTGIPERK